MNLRDGLREISYGDWEGKTQDVREDARSRDVHPLDDRARLELPRPAAKRRVRSRPGRRRSSVRSWTPTPDGNVLVVSHKATIRIMLCSFLGIDLGRYRDRMSALAGSVSVVAFGEYGPRLDLLNDRSHLSEELRSRPGS